MPMTNVATLTANAEIIEINDGPYYSVRFEWVPRVGELIDLYSFAEADACHRTYEVVQVVHLVYDVTQKEPQGHHGLSVYVKPATSKFFRSW